MKANDIRKLTLDEMEQKFKDLTEALFNLRFQHATNQLENTVRLKQTKRDLARINTILWEEHRKLEIHA
jgi:large subunit ribosomal protein L29